MPTNWRRLAVLPIIEVRGIYAQKTGAGLVLEVVALMIGEPVGKTSTTSCKGRIVWRWVELPPTSIGFGGPRLASRILWRWMELPSTSIGFGGHRLLVRGES